MKPKNIDWPTYVRRGVGRRLSMLGERLNIHWLIYNPIHFTHFHESAVANAPGVMRTFAALFPQARRYLDVGAGSGAYAAEAQRRGRDVVACEYSAKGRRIAAKQAVDCRPFDLVKEPPADVGSRPFDLAYCFEVAEHLPATLGDRLVEYLSRQAPTVIFTAAHPGQGGTGHVNEQPKSYWIERFQRAGMRHNPDLTRRVEEMFREEKLSATWLYENALVFERPHDS
jgi:SAM-dependent methyltransferase